MGYDSGTDKINVYVPEKIGQALKRDAELFEIYRVNRTEINLNHFLSCLIVGYYNGYKQERNGKINEMREIMGRYLQDSKKQTAAAEEIMEKVINPPVPKRKGKNPVKLPLKPTRETKQILDEIKGTLGPNDYLSQYLCRMFMSYCEKPAYEREKIIYRDRISFLETACEEKREISFATTYKPDVIRHVIPWEIVPGMDETFNYLLCQEYSDYKERNEAATYRIGRIHQPSWYHTSGTLSSEVVRHLEQMKQIAPQFAINEDLESCILFSPEGQLSCRKIYTGRPTPTRMEDDPGNPGHKKYYFNCSRDQLYRYLIKFNPGEAQILFPAELRARVLQYYHQAIEKMQLKADREPGKS